MVESLLEPGETLEGMCVGSRQGFDRRASSMGGPTQENGVEAVTAWLRPQRPRLRRPGL